MYVDFSDFSLWVLHVERVRWVGGYGRMDSASGAAYATAAPDPIATHAASATTHLDDDHADVLLRIAQALGGYPDATAVQCPAVIAAASTSPCTRPAATHEPASRSPARWPTVRTCARPPGLVIR